VPNVAEVKTRQDYYQIDWPIVTRQRQVGVYAEEVLAVYAPFAMGLFATSETGDAYARNPDAFAGNIQHQGPRVQPGGFRDT
jgi:hypothetical protein